MSLSFFSTASSPFSSSSSSQFNADDDNNNNDDDDKEEGRFALELYMWGTDTKGSLLKPKDRADENVIDVPQPIDKAARGSFYMGNGEASSSKDDDGIIDSATAASPFLSRIVCGATDTAYLLSDGSCYVSGENKQGQLGLGHKDPVAAPAPLVLPNPTTTSGIVMDEYDNNENNNGKDANEPSPTKVVDVALGPAFAAAVDSHGNLYTCGLGGSVIAGFGMLGHGSADSLMEFRRVESLVEDGCQVHQVQVGESHMAVLTTEGEVRGPKQRPAKRGCASANDTRNYSRSMFFSDPIDTTPAYSPFRVFGRSSRAGPEATAVWAISTPPTSCTWSRSKS
jgi:alpha-tubulin suppressor-like RCC1 family protein